MDRCGNHREDQPEDLGDRIPCPLDPGHTVYSKRLKHHLKICSKAREDEIILQQPFYKKGVNAGNPGLVVMSGDVEPVSAASQEVVQAWSDKITAVYPTAVRQVLGVSANPDALLDVSVVAEGTELAHSEKHEVQNQALAALVSRSRFLDEQGAALVEYGCGRGGLASAVMEHCPGCRCVLVDRETRRHKFENKQESRDELVMRLRLDIADFDLDAFLQPTLRDGNNLPVARDFQCGALSMTTVAGAMGPAERLEELWKTAAALQAPPWPPSKLLACAKHLCGGATDVTLRSLSGCRDASVVDRVGVCIATCCHHRCDAGSYVNFSFIQSLGLCETPAEFAQFVSTAGWAVGGIGSRDLAKRRIGMMTKRILDLGRVAWLRDNLGMKNAHIVDYISKSVTPENVVLLAGDIATPTE